jgi:hypothetical protein
MTRAEFVSALEQLGLAPAAARASADLLDRTLGSFSMKQEDLRKAVVLLERIDSLECSRRQMGSIKDMTLNTAGHTLLQIKAGDADSLFPDLVECVCREIDRQLAAVRGKLAALGVEVAPC